MKLAGVVMATLTATSALAAVTIKKIAEYDINNLGCGGIVYLGGDNYYLLQDHDDTTKKATLYPATIKVDPSTGKITNNLKVDIAAAGIALTGNGDSEGIGLDPCSGGVWVSDESGPTIKEFRPTLTMTSVPATRTAPIPSIYSKINSNKGLEALTVSGDGKTMWTANEEALKGDGSLSKYNVSTTVRLTKFERGNVHDNWTAVGQWPYTCQPATSSMVSSYEFCGVSGLCALPDGSLLVLERETSTDTLGRFEIYRLTESSFTSATPILTWTDGLASKSYTAVSKGKALISNKGTSRDSVYSDFDIDVYEGICLGPRLSDGSLSILLVSDGGASAKKEVLFLTFTAYTVPRICALKLSGLGEVDTVDIPAPEQWTASLEGRNYRFMKGTQVTSEITGLPVPVETAYTNRGAVAETGHASWTATGSSGGSGSTMTFTVNGDMQATWTVFTEVETNTTSQLLANDSFEGCPAGTGVASLAGWTNDDEEGVGVVVAETYAPPAVGFPLGRETHTQVLALEDADMKRTYDVDADSRATLDMMISVVRHKRMPVVDDELSQTAVTIDADGHLCLYHRDTAGNAVWTPLSDESFKNDDWVRLSIVIDYASDEHAYLCPRINGALTARGVVSPSSGAAQGGPWYRAVRDAAQDGKGRIQSLTMKGNCKIDDIVVGASGWKQEGVADEPSIPSDQGTLEVAGDVATVKPAPGVRCIFISNGEALAKVILPPSVETVIGVPPGKIVIRASTGHDITGAFRFTVDAEGVKIALDPDGEVTIDGETITVRPQLSSVKGTQESPFEVGEGRVSIGIRSIPDLIYRLSRAADMTVRMTGESVGKPQTAGKTRLVLSDDTILPTKAFYLITVSR